MAFTVTHPFVSAIADDPVAVAAGEVVPSNWNAKHTVTGTIGDTYFVSNSGSDSNNGTSQATPWKTIGHVNGQTFGPGDQILFQGGETFNDAALTLGTGGATLNGSAALPVTFSSYGAGKATIAQTTPGNDCIDITDVGNLVIINLALAGPGSGSGGAIYAQNDSTTTNYSNLTFSNLTITGQKVGIDIEATGAGNLYGFSNVSVTNCSITGFRTTDSGRGGLGVFINDSGGTVYPHQNFTFTGNEITNYQNDGIDANGINGFIFSHNTVHDGGGSGQGNGMGVGLQTIHTTNFTISYNEFYNQLTSTEVDDSDGVGIDIDAYSSNGVVEYNYVHDCAGGGIALINFSPTSPTFHDITVRYNITQNNGNNGGVPVYQGSFELLLGATGGASLSNINVYNNTFYNNTAIAVGVIQFKQANVTGFISNNILISGGNTQHIVSAGSLNPSGMVFNNNDYFGVNSIVWNGTTYSTVSAWSVATSQDANFKTVDPQLHGPGTGGTLGGYYPYGFSSYNLMSGSPLIGAGINIATTYSVATGSTDFFGVAVPYQIISPYQSSGFNIGAGGTSWQSLGVSIDAGYGYSTPTTGATVTLSSTAWHTIIDPAGALFALTVVMPATPIDGQVVDFRLSQAVTTFTVSPNSGQSLSNGPGTSSGVAGASFNAIYKFSNTTWYF